MTPCEQFKAQKGPERIYYAFNSTFGTVVNAISIVHIGADRVIGMRCR